jgi:type I restriction-modification system DNA methylase subunit
MLIAPKWEQRNTMARTPRQSSAAAAGNQSGNGANLGFEAKLRAAAGALRNNVDAAEYKHVVLGLIFLKYISDAFEAKHAELDAQRGQGTEESLSLAAIRDTLLPKLISGELCARDAERMVEASA